MNQKDHALLPACIELIRTKILSKYITVQKPLHRQRNNMDLESEVKLLEAVTSPNFETFH